MSMPAQFHRIPLNLLRNTNLPISSHSWLANGERRTRSNECNINAVSIIKPVFHSTTIYITWTAFIAIIEKEMLCMLRTQQQFNDAQRVNGLKFRFVLKINTIYLQLTILA